MILVSDGTCTSPHSRYCCFAFAWDRDVPLRGVGGGRHAPHIFKFVRKLAISLPSSIGQNAPLNIRCLSTSLARDMLCILRFIHGIALKSYPWCPVANLTRPCLQSITGTDSDDFICFQKSSELSWDCIYLNHITDPCLSNSLFIDNCCFILDAVHLEYFKRIFTTNLINSAFQWNDAVSQ